ncbi:hypothetical protein FPV67DRAFT_1728203, partial [Lyophyllum atratum]
EDGIGQDDDSDEEVDDDAFDNKKSTSSRHARTRCPLPTWLQTAFDARVEESSKRGPDGLPPLYHDQRTFWFPQPATFFQLCSLDISPEAIYPCDMFLWDPECLLPDGIACPNKNCGTRLWRHGVILRPRRVVDLDRTYWIIGYRYRCPKCVRPNTVTFRSWDPQILATLQRPLAAQFPARLSHRSGMSINALNFMRSCFQHGMGAKQFSNSLLVQHLEKYDALQLQYLQTIAILDRTSNALLGDHKFKSFLPFHDRSSDGFHGFVPSSQWLRDMYDAVIEEHQQELNQHTAMLTGDVNAIDHSFKIPKHIAHVDGVQVFTALLTVTNEKGEIRACNLVASKSHSQFELALLQMRESLELYGHDQPRLFYTDNMADKEFLEKCFPSLRHDVVPVEKHAKLDPLTIPPNVQVTVKNSVLAIDDAMRTILDLLPDDDSSPSNPIVIGLDAEWNVETSERGYVTGRGQTAILQVAHGSNIFILQIGPMLAGKQLPLQLKQVLANPMIIKVGRCVTGDLKYLEQACQSTANFDVELTPEQIRYAALDAYASLAIYNTLVVIPVPTPLSDNPEVGTPIILRSGDHTRVLARGVVSPHANNVSYSGIAITPSRCVIEVHDVLVPGALITHGGRNSTKRFLKEFGQPPFHLVCLRSHLRNSVTRSGAMSASHSSYSLPETLPNEELPLTDSDDPRQGSPIEEERNISSHESVRVGDLLHESLSTIPSEPAAREHHIIDPASREMGERILQETGASTWVNHRRSGVVKDAFHIFNMFYISAAHGLLQEFAIALRDAIFIPDQDDKARVIAWGRTQDPPQSWSEILFQRPDWLWRRCKRIIPPPEELYPLVSRVFQGYGPLKDAKTGLPLFNSAAWAVAKNVLELIQKGFVSDPPGIPLYYQLGIDGKTGLPLHRCIRGTNMTEGGVHTHLRSRLPTSGVSIRHMQSCLLDFILRHNMLVGTFNSTGQRYIGHYSIWLTNELQETLCLVQHMLIRPRVMTGWVNGNLYEPTREVAGVLPIPEDVRRKSAMGSYIPGLHAKQRHHFLASMQGTRKPVLPIHNDSEKELFRRLMTGNTGFSDPVSGPRWDVAVEIWNNEADRNEKLTEQLKVYYNGAWKKNANTKQTKAMTALVRLPIKEAVRNPQRSRDAPKVPERTRELHSATKGLLQLELPPQSTSANRAPTPHTSPTPAPVPSSSALMPAPAVLALPAPQPLPSESQFHSAALELARKRARASIPDLPNKRQRKRRTCRKCGDPECPGNQKVSNCRNPCQDCGQMNCRGRNTSKRSKNC